MTYCIICENDEHKTISCVSCLKINCVNCLINNKDKCCFCNVIQDDITREIQFQISLLYQTKKELQIETKKCSNSKFKKCPGCGVLIEKKEDECNQICCIICNTVWHWDTLSVIKNIYDIHNPLYFNNTTINYDNILFSNHSSKIKKAIIKCLKYINNEIANYRSDCYIYRLLYLTEKIDLDKFKSNIYDRYNTFLKNKKLKNVLENNIDNEKLKKIDETWVVTKTKINLPYV